MRDNNTDFFTAMDAMEASGRTGDQLKGKALKGYQVIQPTYSPEYLQRNQSLELPVHMRDKITQPPDQVFAVNGRKVESEIRKAGDALDPSKISFPNNNYSSSPAARGYYDVSVDSDAVQNISVGELHLRFCQI